MTHKLLLADDSVTIQKVVELTFADEDFEIIAVSDGNAAFERIKAERPDIILSDVIMPGLNGYELCAKVKSEADLSSTPFLFLKGTFESFDEERASGAGADGFIVKPFESNELISKVKELIEQYGRQAEAIPAEAPEAEMAEEIPMGEEIPASGFGEEASIEVEEEEFEEIPKDLVETGAEAMAEEKEEISEEDLWSEVKITDHPIPPASETAEFGTGIIQEEAAPVEEAPAFGEGPVIPEEAAPAEEGPVLEEVEPFMEEEAVEAPEPFMGAPVEEAPETVFAAPEEEMPAAGEPEAPSFEEPVMAPAAEAPSVSADMVEKVLSAKIEEVLRDVAPDIIREITRKVVSDVVWEVVPDTAEKMIKAEIDRLTGGGGY